MRFFRLNNFLTYMYKKYDYKIISKKIFDRKNAICKRD